MELNRPMNENYWKNDMGGSYPVVRREALPEPKPGEVWVTKKGYLQLIVSRHGVLSTVLPLRQEDYKYAVPVTCRNDVYYANPSACSYAKLADEDRLVDAMDASSFREVLLATREILFPGLGGDPTHSTQADQHEQQMTVEDMLDRLDVSDVIEHYGLSYNVGCAVAALLEDSGEPESLREAMDRLERELKRKER